MNKKIEEILRHRLDTDATGISIAVDDIEQLIDIEVVKFFDWAVEKLAYSYSDDTTTPITTFELLTLYKSQAEQCG